MIDKEEALALLHSTESFRVERTISTTNMDKFCEAICAFSNDLPNSRQNGYLLIGATDDGQLSGLAVGDNLLKKISAIRSDGNILPIPTMSVDKLTFPEGDLLVVEVQPSLHPPVRYKGRVFVRIGPRRDIASEDEERILTERRTANMATFDVLPCWRARLEDIDVDIIRKDYLPHAVDAAALAEDRRDIKEQLASLSLYDLENDRPTNAAVILFGKNPRHFLPGAYVQYVKFDGRDRAATIINERVFSGGLVEMLPKLDVFTENSVVTTRPVPITAFREKQTISYPKDALRELLLNAVMHRDYQANTPIRYYEYRGRVEIMNAGGLYGKARPENFPHVNDYRNPVIAEALRNLGYVNMFNRGISRVSALLEENGNVGTLFNVNLITVFEVVTPISGDVSLWYPDEVSENETGERNDVEQGERNDKKGERNDVEQGERNGKKSERNNDKQGERKNKKGERNGKKGERNEIRKRREESIIEYCKMPRSKTEIMNHVGLKSKNTFWRLYIVPLIRSGRLQMTIPDQPKNRNQKYVAVSQNKEI
ncbi:MAG: putative DNA binding domain-containing protein [Bacteroidales bacterium]|nr:putative DNA binding domain-containing protein [Bacteroidales bacterium]